MKRTKKTLGRMRRFWALCFAVIMVLGTISVPGVASYAAPPNEEPKDFYRVQWPVNDPVGYCNIHFVDKDGKGLPIGTHYIDVGENDGTRLNNVKSIWGDGNENVYGIMGVEGGYYISLLELISTNSTDKFYNEGLKDYEFVKAYVGDNNGAFVDDDAHFILPYLYGVGSGELDEEIDIRYYKKFCPDVDDILDEQYGASANEKDIYLVYEKRKAPTVIENTISNDEIGLDIYMFNYDNKPDGEGLADSAGTWGTDGYNGNGLTQGLYSKVLDDGFPEYNNGDEHVDMEDFFNPDSKYCVGKADNLFQQYANGIYYYNSAWNAAYYNQETKKFVLYDEVVAPMVTSIAGYSAYKKGNFLPFNDIDKDKIWAFNIDDDQNAEPVYGLAGAKMADYHFGMYLTGNIYQPENGKIKDANGNETNMIFNITGDDDILVYIDDVLVLDMGGIHDPWKGSIDFATGDVKVNGYPDTTLKALLDGKATDYNGNPIKFQENTLANNSLHSFKVFYAERGMGASNLLVELNAPKAPSLTIKKSFWEDKDGNYNTAFNGMNSNIQNAKYILKEVTVDADGNIISTVNDNVQTISYADFNDDGTYVFENLDYEKHYVVEQQLYDDDGNVFDGSTNEHPYEFTLLDVDGVNTGNKMTKDMVTPVIGFIDENNVFLYPTIEFKNVYNNVTLEKNIVVNGSEQKYDDISVEGVDKDNASVKFQIESVVPDYSAYPDGTPVYKIVDKISEGLTKIEDVKVYFRDKDSKTLNPIKIGTEPEMVSIEQSNGLTVTLNNPKEYANKVIVVQYSVTNKSSKNSGMPETNRAHAEYSITPSGDGDTSIGKTEEDVNYVYTFGIDANLTGANGENIRTSEIKKITKIKRAGGTEENVPLKGAEFTLYKADADYHYNATTDVLQTQTSNADGLISFRQLDAGKYILVETGAPEGYANDLTEHKVEIRAAYADDGKIQSYTVTIDETNVSVYNATFSADGKLTYSAADNNKGVEIINNPKKGSIVIDNSFILSKLDGTSRNLDKAPDETEFANVVFTVKDEAGNVVATVKYSEFTDGKYKIDNLDVTQKYSVEISGITENGGNGGTEDQPYVSTTVGGTTSYIFEGLVPSADGTILQVVNYYQDDSQTKTPTTEEDDDEDDDDDETDSNSNKTHAKTGDDHPITLLTVLLLFALCGVGVCIALKRKKEN